MVRLEERDRCWALLPKQNDLTPTENRGIKIVPNTKKIEPHRNYKRGTILLTLLDSDARSIASISQPRPFHKNMLAFPYWAIDQSAIFSYH
jgi:hypothetical protein